MSAEPTYYERWGPVARRMRRAGHRLRGFARSSLGLKPTILVEIRWRLGDEIMALPIYAALRDKYPEARLAVLCTYPELLDDYPFIDAVNPENLAPDAYILLRGAARDVARVQDYAATAGVDVPDARPRVYCERWTTPLTEELPGGSGPLVALAPGASWKPKRWAVARWRAVAEGLRARGARVFELGGAGESAGIATSFVGRTRVRDAAALLREADLAIAHDSGLMHLARAVGTETIALFGPTAPELLVGDDAGVRAVKNGRPCQACWNAGAMRTPGTCPRDIGDCLGTIAVSDVIAEACDALGIA